MWDPSSLEQNFASLLCIKIGFDKEWKKERERNIERGRNKDRDREIERQTETNKDRDTERARNLETERYALTKP